MRARSSEGLDSPATFTQLMANLAYAARVLMVAVVSGLVAGYLSTKNILPWASRARPTHFQRKQTYQVAEHEQAYQTSLSSRTRELSCSKARMWT